MGNQNFSVINLDGGLNLVDTHYSLQTKIGTCKILDNFESSIDGGYRRINGYTMFGDTQPSGSNEILGVFPYADGVLAVAGTGVYFSTDGNTWLQVNRDTWESQTGTVQVTNTSGSYVDVQGTGTFFLNTFSVGGHVRIDGHIREIAAVISNTEMTLVSEISGGVLSGTAVYKNGTSTLAGSIQFRTAQGQTEFAWLEDDGEYGSVVLADTTGSNNCARFKVTGSGGARAYEYDTLSPEAYAAPTTPRHCVTFEQRVVVADVYEESSRESGTVAWSDRYQNLRFDGGSSGTVQVDSPVVALVPFRDRLIIFCRNSIYQLTSINDPASLEVRPISYNTGCVSAGSVQEIAGEVVFLSYDGIRTLSASDRYGDVQFGVISTDVDPYVKEIINAAETLRITSCIIRYKNQYRLFYTNPNYTPDRQFGLVGTLKKSREGILAWQWSRIKNVPVAALATATNPFLSLGTRDEKVFHGGYDGYVYRHDFGDDFNGDNIIAEMELNELDYGDAGLKKTLHYVKSFGQIEGSTDVINLSIKYDYNSPRTMQPGEYALELDGGLPKYGTAVFGTATYGGGSYFTTITNVEGSGFSNNFTLLSDGTGAPYKLDSLYVDIRLGAKQ